MTPRARTVLAAGVTLILCAVFVRLGVWQWQRWRTSAAEWERFARGADALQPLGARTLEEVALYQRVSVAGRLDGAHQFLLDNRSYRGQAGYEVLTPLTRADGRVLLIDRGWVAFTGSRAHLPDVSLDSEATVILSGRAAQLPSAGLASGRAAPQPADPWPKVTSFPRPGELAQALGAPLEAHPAARCSGSLRPGARLAAARHVPAPPSRLRDPVVVLRRARAHRLGGADAPTESTP
jgi:cytochrome oxidase assembly protein ShyY1